MKRLLATRRLENVPDSRQHRWLHLVCRNLQRVAAQGDRAACVFTCQCVHSVHIYGAFLCGVANGAVVSCSCVYNKNGFFNCFFFCLNKNIKHDLNTSSTKSSIENWVQLLYTLSKPFFFLCCESDTLRPHSFLCGTFVAPVSSLPLFTTCWVAGSFRSSAKIAVSPVSFYCAGLNCTSCCLYFYVLSSTSLCNWRESDRSYIMMKSVGPFLWNSWEYFCKGVKKRSAFRRSPTP